MIYSHSRLKKYEDCPWAWFQIYVLKKDEVLNEVLVMGKVVHRAVEILAKDSSVELDSALFTAIAEEGSVAVDWGFAKTMVIKAVDYLKTLGPIEAETHFQLPLDTGDPFSPEIQGYIDIFEVQKIFLLDLLYICGTFK